MLFGGQVEPSAVPAGEDLGGVNTAVVDQSCDMNGTATRHDRVVWSETGSEDLLALRTSPRSPRSSGSGFEFCSSPSVERATRGPGDTADSGPGLKNINSGQREGTFVFHQ